MSVWESIRGVFTPGCAPPIPQDPEVGTLKPQNPHRRRMEFEAEDDVQDDVLHPEDLQGIVSEDQPGSESRFQTLDQTGEPG